MDPSYHLFCRGAIHPAQVISTVSRDFKTPGKKGEQVTEKGIKEARRAAVTKAMNGVMSRGMSPSASLCDLLLGLEPDKSMVPAAVFEQYLLKKKQ